MSVDFDRVPKRVAGQRLAAVDGLTRGGARGGGQDALQRIEVAQVSPLGEPPIRTEQEVGAGREQRRERIGSRKELLRKARAQARELLGLSDTEAELLPHLRRGWALWKVGQRSFLVQHRLSSLERDIVDTDARMAVRTAA